MNTQFFEDKKLFLLLDVIDGEISQGEYEKNKKNVAIEQIKHNISKGYTYNAQLVAKQNGLPLPSNPLPHEGHIRYFKDCIIDSEMYK